jgi:pyrroline-5-carboxylate reductase
MTDLPADTTTVAFIGGGNMASAIIGGMEAGDRGWTIRVCDQQPAIRERHHAAGRIVLGTIADTCTGSDVVVIAVKPQGIDPVLAELAPVLGPSTLVVSICAGITSARIEAALPTGTRVVRTMPNTPMMVGQGMVGISAGSTAGDSDCRQVELMFGSAAATMRIPEERMDALTAVSGSGPAYFFRFCEVLVEAAEELGFSRAEANLLVGQTASGAIAYLCDQGDFPAGRLRQQVTSPGGTTEAALRVMDDHDLAGMMRSALEAAYRRGQELS